MFLIQSLKITEPDIKKYWVRDSDKQGYSLASWKRDAVEHWLINLLVISQKIAYGVDILLYQPSLHPNFAYCLS